MTNTRVLALMTRPEAKTEFEQHSDSGFPTLAEIERAAIERALSLCNGNMARAAALLGVAPSTLYRKRQNWRGFVS